MAAPHVAAVAGMVATATPGLASQAIAQSLQRSAASTTGGGWTGQFGYGIVDAFSAVSGEKGSRRRAEWWDKLIDQTNVPVAGTITAGGRPPPRIGQACSAFRALLPGSYTLAATSSAGTQS